MTNLVDFPPLSQSDSVLPDPFPLAQSLDSPEEYTSPRLFLKPYFDELCNVLETLKTQDMNMQAAAHFKKAINEARSISARMNHEKKKRKRREDEDALDFGTVSAMTERAPTSFSRRLLSNNC